ncbi:MAG TPA: hypothetical protein VFF89_00860 [Sphingobium sp.]|nr:hypothetical protein [Sphingobium sp.]
MDESTCLAGLCGSHIHRVARRSGITGNTRHRRQGRTSIRPASFYQSMVNKI